MINLRIVDFLFCRNGIGQATTRCCPRVQLLSECINLSVTHTQKPTHTHTYNQLNAISKMSHTYIYILYTYIYMNVEK